MAQFAHRKQFLRKLAKILTTLHFPLRTYLGYESVRPARTDRADGTYIGVVDGSRFEWQDQLPFIRPLVVEFTLKCLLETRYARISVPSRRDESSSPELQQALGYTLHLRPGW